MRYRTVLIMCVVDSSRSCRESIQVELVRLVTLNEVKMISLNSGENLDGLTKSNDE